MNIPEDEHYKPTTHATSDALSQQAVPSDDIPEDENVVDEPLADKSDVTAPMHDTEDPVNNARTVPGLDPDKVDAMRDESRQEIDFREGRMRDIDLTQGRSVIDAEFDDRGAAKTIDSDE